MGENPLGIMENGYACISEFYSSTTMLYKYQLTDYYSFYLSIYHENRSIFDFYDQLYVRHTDSGYVAGL